MTTFTTSEVEAALAVWEAMLEHREALPVLHKRWEEVGTVALRHKAMEIGRHVNTAWRSLSEEERGEFIPFDWEFVPAYVRLWYAPTKPTPEIILIAIQQLVGMNPDEREIELERATNAPF